MLLGAAREVSNKVTGDGVGEGLGMGLGMGLSRKVDCSGLSTQPAVISARDFCKTVRISAKIGLFGRTETMSTFAFDPAGE